MLLLDGPIWPGPALARHRGQLGVKQGCRRRQICAEGPFSENAMDAIPTAQRLAAKLIDWFADILVAVFIGDVQYLRARRCRR